MIDKEKLLELHVSGKTCQEIRDELGYSLTTIRKYIRDAGYVPNSKICKLDDVILNDVSKCLDEGKTNKEIATELGISPTTARKYTKEILNRQTNSVKHHRVASIELTQEQLEVLYGSLLGDMCITKSKNLCRVCINHGGDQEAYFDHKCAIFDGLLGKISKTPRYDKRTNKYYNKFTVRLLSHSTYNKLYDQLYINGVKTLTREWLDKVTPRGLAFWFMDDGCNSGTLATNCFTLDECETIQRWLKEVYNVDTTLQKAPNEQYVVYIKSSSRRTFYNIVIPYIIPSMLYKLNNWNLKPCELRETP